MHYSRIAEARGVKPVTVRNAVYGIQQKLRVDTMQGLVLWSVRNGPLDNCEAEAAVGEAESG